MTVEQGIEEPEQAPPEDAPVEEPPPPPLSVQARVMRGILVVALLGVAAAGAIFAVADRQTNDQLVLRVTHPSSIAPGAVERAIATAPEPTQNGPRNTKVVDTRCTPGSTGTLRNPWRCDVRFVTGRVVHYIVRIDNRGAFVGEHRPPISGCCIAVPRATG